MPPFKIKEFQNEIDFPDAESVSKGVAHVLEVVERYDLVGKLVTSRVNNTEEYVTTRENREVSIFAFSVLINAMRSF